MSQLKLVRKETALEDVFRTFKLNRLGDVDVITYLEMASHYIEKQIKKD